LTEYISLIVKGIMAKCHLNTNRGLAKVFGAPVQCIWESPWWLLSWKKWFTAAAISQELSRFMLCVLHCANSRLQDRHVSRLHKGVTKYVFGGGCGSLKLYLTSVM